MASFNRVLLMGNLTADPEVRYTSGQMAIAKLRLAVNRRYTKADGTQAEEVTYVDCDAFGKQAETLQKYMTKGKPIFIEGRLRLESWETQAGEKRSKLSVVVENFQFLGSAGGGRGEGGDAPNAERDYDEHAPPARPARPSGQPGNVRRAPPSSSVSEPPTRGGGNQRLEDDDVPF